ncbi:hypothetical protein CEP54_002302 [Fusarium duplospermum]|uniref:Uncharacterized protein n=1 Tax=Fusarium duplospermum TaxID=1325734 RepID=A0A428QVZ6_9HYPO|nr:hypothetical protein CEP54_002302 [Fusarium duplospermum]
MASWEAAALKLQGHVAVTSDPNSLDKDKCLPPLPLQQKSTVTTTIEAITSEKDSNSTKGWKPLSLSTPILSAVIALTLLLAAAVETIAQRSAAQGGLALSPTLDDLPGYAKFSYLYVPTIIAVLYSMIWSWIDLDVKRMQPWFELSKPKGATAENSLFLDYQYEFVALVPFKAAKQKHWPVFFAGTSMVMVFWLLTPLQSALLGTEVVTKTELANLGNRSQLLPLEKQLPLLDPEVLNNGYAVGWLGQPFPPFTTSDYALLPFYVDDDPAPPKVETNWTAETTKLSTELSCWPAEIEKNGPRSKAAWDILNGQGCNMTLWMNLNMNYSMYYIGYYSNAYADYYLGGPQCRPTVNSTHQFLAVWATPIKVPGEETPDFNISAIYCQPTYYRQRVLAKVKSSTLEPDTKFMETLAPREILSEKEFNSTAFEYLLANGMAEKIIVRDYPFSKVVEQHPRLNKTGLTRPVSNMVGYALAGRDSPVTDYASPDLLEKIYNDAHQYLFSLAVHQMLTNETEISNRTVSVDFFLTGVVVSRAFATSVECLMVIIALFAALVLRFSRAASSNLTMNPSSMARYLDIFRDSPEFLRTMASMDNADEKTLLEEFRQDTARLHYDNQSKTTKVSIDKNFEVLQILENYIPTIFATLIEPFWVLLNRLLCALQPFKDLWKGKAESSRSISTSYTSIPPQLVIWRAVKSGHFILVLVCSMALLANVLAVGLGSLFNEGPMIAEYSEDLTPAFASRFDNASVYGFPDFLVHDLITTNQYADHYYVAMANLSSGTTLPPWVSKDYYFQRHKIDPSRVSKSRDVYNIQARGFGARGNCTPTPPQRLPVPKTVSQDEDRDYLKVKESECGDLIDFAGRKMRAETFNRSSGVSAAEFCGTMGSSFGPVPCGRTLILGWGRTPKAENVNATVDASFMTCRPVFETAMFNLTVDMSGHVISYERTSKLETALDYAESESHSGIIFQTANHHWNQLAAQWHNDSTARDWMNYFTLVSTEFRSALDPDTPAPKPDKLVPVVEDIYRRVFAILLSLNEQLFDHSEEQKPTTAIRRTQETRIFMEDASFIMTMTVLAMNTIVAVIFYSRAVPFVLPRMPTTLGSVMAYLAPSRLTSHAFGNVPGNSGRTLSFGRYIGRDGQVHIGIEMDPHVVPVDPLSLKDDGKLLDRLLRRKPQPETRAVRSGTWL